MGEKREGELYQNILYYFNKQNKKIKIKTLGAQ